MYCFCLSFIHEHYTYLSTLMYHDHQECRECLIEQHMNHLHSPHARVALTPSHSGVVYKRGASAVLRFAMHTEKGTTKQGGEVDPGLV